MYLYKLDIILKNIEGPYELHGASENVATKICSIYEPVDQGLSWMRAMGEEARAFLLSTPASVIVCKKIDVPPELDSTKTLIFVENPHLTFLRLVKRLFPDRLNNSAGIHETAIVSPNARIGKAVSIGAFAQIGDCEIGDAAVIKGGAIIHDRVVIGARVLISEFCNIGGQGFGHIKNEAGQLENMLHIGGVVIEDDVEIFPYSNVDSGTLGPTRIGRGTKIDHYCHIGHNSKIGTDNVITPNVTTLGGVTIGNGCMIGCGAQLRDRVEIGSGVTIGMSSTVTKNVPDGETWVGSPAIELNEFKRRQKTFSQA